MNITLDSVWSRLISLIAEIFSEDVVAHIALRLDLSYWLLLTSTSLTLLSSVV